MPARGDNRPPPVRAEALDEAHLMRRSIIMLLISLPLLCGTTIYRWTDSDGNVHFGDDPPAGAERVEVGEPAVVSTPPRTAHPTPAPTPSEAPAPAYRLFEIVSPADDAVVRDNLGRVPVNIDIDPPLRGNHRIDVRLDGARHPDQPATRSTAFTLHDVDRGTHTLEVRVLDSAGNVLARSASQFHLHRATVHSPARQNN